MANFAPQILPIPLNQLPSSQAKLQSTTARRNPAPLPTAHPTPSFWLNSDRDANPLADVGSTGALTEDADVVIVGSGITGVSAAYHFSKLSNSGTGGGRPLKVVVLEARQFCSGATGRNGGHFTPLAFEHFRNLASTYGEPEAKKSYALEHHTVNTILELIKREQLEDAIDLVSAGSNIVLFSKDEHDGLKADYEAAKAAGVDVERVRWLSREDMEEQYGVSFPAVRRPGNNLWPLKLVTALYNLASRSSSPASDAGGFSLILHTHTPVTSIRSIPHTTPPPHRHRDDVSGSDSGPPPPLALEPTHRPRR